MGVAVLKAAPRLGVLADVGTGGPGHVSMVTSHQRPGLPGWGAPAGNRTRCSYVVSTGQSSRPRAHPETTVEV